MFLTRTLLGTFIYLVNSRNHLGQQDVSVRLRGLGLVSRVVAGGFVL